MITYSTLIKAYDNMNQFQKVIEIHRDMIQKQIQPNVITYNTLIKAYDNMNQFQKADMKYIKI